MRKPFGLIYRVFAKVLAIFCGILTGTALAVAIVEGGPDVWINSIRLLDPAPLVPGEAYDTWILVVAAEWRIAVASACFIAFVGSLLWELVRWRRRDSYISAMILGFALSGLMAALWFGGDFGSAGVTGVTVIFRCLLLGGAGAVAGLVTFGVDRALQRDPGVGG